MLPLHKEAQQAQKGNDFHAGLWYDRFFDQYDNNDCKVSDKGKTNWIKTVTSSQVGDESMLADFITRQKTLIEACGGQTLVMSSQWHFVTGMGNNHPVENGFAWHHTLGVPYLTGAAVKGMVHAWCEVWEGFDEEQIKHWFGGKGDEQAGELIFFDAIPMKPVQLKADIMTPHYGDWYAKGDEAPKQDGSNVPADWHNPIPVPFLVVDAGQSFQFSMAKRANSSIELKDVADALTQALQWLGAGAKTAAGYGRFEEDQQAKIAREKVVHEKQQKEEKAQVQAELEAKRANMTPLQADLDRWQASDPEPNTVSAWLSKAKTLPLEDQKCIADVLKVYYEQRGTWKKPSKKQKANVQAIKQILNA